MNALISELPWGWMSEMVRIVFWMTPLIAVLLLARSWLRKWIGGRGMALIWIVVTVRLLVPVVWTIPQEWNVEVREIVEKKEAVLGGNMGVLEGKTPEMGESGVKAGPDWGRRLAAIWLMGTAAFAGWLLLGIVRLWRLPTREVKDGALLAAWAGVDERLKGKVALKWSTAVSAPALVALGGGNVGFAIWVPEDWRLSEEQWRHVLLHELGHYQRGDLWTQWLGALAQALYWWNPLVWIMNRAASADREVACDEWVRRNWANAEEYGATLIAVSRRVQNGGMPPGAVLMATGREQLKKRVEAMSRGAVAAGWKGAALGAVVMIGAFGVTAKAERKTGEPPLDWTSEEGRKVSRKANNIRYNEILRHGGLDVQSCLYELSRADAQKLVREIFGEEAPSIMGITDNQVRQLDRSKRVKSRLLISNQPLSERANQRNKGEIAWSEIVRELRYFYEYGNEEGKVVPLKSEITPVGLRVGTKNWKRFGDLLEFGMVVEVRELLGWHHFLDQRKPYRQAPWARGVLNRLSEIPNGPNDFATPVFFTSRIEASTTIVSNVSNYILLRLPSQVVSFRPDGKRPEEKPDQSSFPGHPVYDQEYWMVLRVEVIPPKKGSLE